MSAVAGGRCLLLVLGAGRSGTSLLTRIVGQLGFYVPQPEIEADDTNPRGFGEPEWLVEFQDELMRRLHVTVFDSRPRAWRITGRVVDDPAIREQLLTWLGTELAKADAVVIKDPRTVWFLPLWMSCTDELSVSPTYLTMLRHPSEVLASARAAYGDWQTDASRAAGWLNVMLETERATRGRPRLYVRYDDLLTDWRGAIERIGDRLDLALLRRRDDEGHGGVGELVDPALRRSGVGWDDLQVPASVREMAEYVWARLQQLHDPGGDNAAAHAELDEMRAAFESFYSEAESIAQSSSHALKPRRPVEDKEPAPSTLRTRLARRFPDRYRRRLRRASTMWRRAV